MAVKRNIQYLNKSFSDLRSQLINFSQTYFPTTYTDFDPSSPGIMFMEQASYVGDVLSFYLDNQLQETYIQYARQTNNLYDLAYMFGYKPKTTGLAIVDLDFFQLIPSKVEGSTTVPDYDYALRINANTQITSRSSSRIAFLTEDSVDFSTDSPLDPRSTTIAQIDTITGEPTYYLLKKTKKATSGNINTTNFNFGSFQEFPTVTINSPNISGIIDIFDSDGNRYYEVDYLGQEIVFDSIKNLNTNDPNNYQDSNDVPYILQTKQVQRRFATRFLDNETLQLQFGSGNPSDTDEEIIPNPNNVGLGLPYEKDKLTTAFSPTNFILTNTYGVAPSNTSLTVRYTTGGGVESNIPANNLTSLNTNGVQFINNNLNSTTAQYIFDSVAVNNPRAASGGQDGDSITELRENTISNFNSQLRNVTANDYLIRALSMPSKFGIISKAHVQKPKASSTDSTLDLYVLSYDNSKSLTLSSQALKTNLKTYINQYRMIGDLPAIRDAFIINIAVDFEIITEPNYNNSEVLTQCIFFLQDYFAIDKWQINQPIILKQIELGLDDIEGVQTVSRVTITNKAGTDSNYSQYAYDIEGATQNKIIYPSIDPSIFEIKFPNQDIKGKVTTI